MGMNRKPDPLPVPRCLFLAGQFGLDLADAPCKGLCVLGLVFYGNIMLTAHLRQFTLKVGGGRKMVF